ncbi:unnamed protein product [Spirodela intermedia]|uniref:Uncharacterized protein n=1 Tax=Spirodela intermedia TaxID=51605 RepID=A0A7I8K9W2_SPIIN|nr:unnamed protein product [Spirodela intermedia]
MGMKGKVSKGTSKEKRTKLQLADGSIRQPIRKLEDVIVRVENYCFPVDFIVADMKVIENLSHAPIILGRPFSATSQVSTDFGKGIVKIKVGKKSSLKYVCHGPCRTYLVIISSRLSCDQELSLLEILKMHKSAIGWSIDDIHGISKDM